MNPHTPSRAPFVTQLPYSPELGAKLREQAVADSRPVWLRLQGGEQELFAAWPERVLRLDNGVLALYEKGQCEKGHCDTLPGGASGLWPWLQKDARLTDSPSPLTDSPFPSTDSPFKGGWLGLFAYDLASALPCRAPRLDFPEVLLGDYRCFVFIDHRHHVAELVTLSGHSSHTDDWTALLDTCQQDHPSLTFSLDQPFEPLTSRAQYLTDFRQIQAYLQAGDCYQVNYAQAFRARCRGSGAAAMGRLLALSRASHAAWMLAPEGEVLSLSPELFLSVRDGKVVTKPIKGTAPRSADPVQDARNRDELAASPKNRAENLMIVDLLRHDLSRHAATGTVQVEKLFAVESLPQVHHLVSTVTAQLAPGSDAIDVIRDSFPGGSITGAPKKRAMEIIAELEPTPRSVYCGSIGFIGANGDAELNIAIRTLLRLGNDLYTWAGGGIVADSDGEAEYQECFDKMGALMRALEDWAF